MNKKIVFLLIVLILPWSELYSGQKLSENHSTTSYEASEGLFLHHLKKFIEVIAQNSTNYKLDIKAGLEAGKKPKDKMSAKHRLHITITRTGSETIGIRLLNSWHDVGILRNAATSEIILPEAGIKFKGKGKLNDQKDTLNPSTLINRLFTAETSLSSALTLINSDYSILLIKNLLLPDLTQVRETQKNNDKLIFKAGKSFKIEIKRKASSDLHFKLKTDRLFLNHFNYVEATIKKGDFSDGLHFWPDKKLKEVPVNRHELEKMVFRACKRFLAIRFPGAIIRPQAKKVPNGELRYQDGQCLVLLSGNPEEIGKAHGLLLGQWAQQVVDSTLYLVGLFETISQGKWFLTELDNAWSRLSPHIPSSHKSEIEALASSCPEISLRELRLSNIFPEYFHCSGFALFGRATDDGLLYHGRILDYMTEIGLQNNAVAFVIKPDNKIAFFSPGFAGITGPVSGMNEKQISIGEMGGRGRYQWDGVPMSILMRRALEECNSLEQVKNLWQNNPRTCEYFYVFADGKIPDAVAVRATSDSIVFLNAGQSHHFLGKGIEDTVILSAGNRLKLLRKRISENYGTFNASSAMRLMDRPVAMKSNLRNVLFIPQLLKIFISVATPNEPAAQKPYVEYDFEKLLKQLQ
ncbi:MAG: C45 family autoproteolytic acyltransferase/hydrolase [Candidatus Rifleibacteriota bacterium]